MQPLVLLPFLVASAFAGDLLTGAPIVHSVEPLPQYTQEQNTATGEYGYSYQGGPSAKTEFRAIDGTTTGTYSYVDAHGILQTVNYIADEFGFRAAGSNIPTEGSVPLDAPDVAAAKAAHLAEHSRATLEALSQHRRKRSYPVGLASVPVAHAAIPVAHSVIPIARAAFPIATSSQHHVQIHSSPVLSHSLLFRKKRGIAAYAAPLPASSAKIFGELSQQPLLHSTAYAAPLAARAAIAAPAIAAPLASHSIVESLPLATSSQSRFQIHNGARIISQEIATPAVLPAAPIVEAKAALPIASHTVVQSLPLATSSQSRFQVHSGAKIITQELHAAPALPAYAPALPAYAPSLPAYAPSLPAYAPALPAAPIYPGSLNHEFGAAAFPAEAASFGDDAITVESA